MNKFRLITLLLSLCLMISVKAGGDVHVFYGDLKSGQMAIINRVFKPELERLKKFNEVRSIIEWPKGEIENLLTVLRSPSTLGVLFLGHPAIKTKGEIPDKKIIHGFLKSGDGYYLPKEILSATHGKVKFLSIMTCHESAILPLYLGSLPEGVDVIKSPTHGLDTLDNPLFEFTSFYSTPKVIDILEENLKKGKYSQFEVSAQVEETEIKISYRDLVSSRFTYTVKSNGKVVGLLKKEVNSRGRVLNKYTKTIRVRQGEDRHLTISPDDPKRPRPLGLKVVDDILLEKIEVQRGDSFNNILENSYHLGDQPEKPDESEGLGFLRNRKAFEEGIFQSFWEGML